MRSHGECVALGNEIADKLSGQCIHDHQHYIDEATPALNDTEEAIVCATIDETVFCCTTCGWWCEMDEMSETDMVCTDCEMN